MSETGGVLFVIFMIIAWVMTIYTLNFHYLSYRSRRNIGHEKLANQTLNLISNSHFPDVTIQLPIYNEKYVSY